MDKSWMMKPRISNKYIDGCRSFVDFAIQNCKTLDGLIYCLCKTCCLTPALVYDQANYHENEHLQLNHNHHYDPHEKDIYYVRTDLQPIEVYVIS
jgi:hypothetical protein